MAANDPGYCARCKKWTSQTFGRWCARCYHWIIEESGFEVSAHDSAREERIELYQQRAEQGLPLFG